MEKPEISIVLPCRDEENALPFCLDKIKQVILKNHINAEIIVSDSSSDRSPEIAKKEGVVLIKHDKDGYGSAYLEAFKIVSGKYIFMADADGTYDFEEIPRFIKFLRDGYDFVIGDRFSKKMEKGSMPFLHKLGNPLLSGTLRVFFGTKVKDSHCGMRAISKKTLEKLNLQTTGMEFASEMVIKAIRNNSKIKELPIIYRRRMGKSKLKPVSDSWRHMRFMLLYSPFFLFFIPGLILTSAGFIFFLTKMYLLFSLLIILGYQLIVFSVFAKTYSIIHLKENPEFINKIYKYLTIEKAIFIGSIIIILGILLTINNSVVAMTLIITGIQTIFSSFMLSILSIKEK